MYCLVLANSCTKACLRAGTMYTISSDFSKQTKSSRAGLKLGKKKYISCVEDLNRHFEEYNFEFWQFSKYFQNNFCTLKISHFVYFHFFRCWKVSAMDGVC